MYGGSGPAHDNVKQGATRRRRTPKGLSRIPEPLSPRLSRPPLPQGPPFPRHHRVPEPAVPLEAWIHRGSPPARRSRNQTPVRTWERGRPARPGAAIGNSRQVREHLSNYRNRMPRRQGEPRNSDDPTVFGTLAENRELLRNHEGREQPVKCRTTPGPSVTMHPATTDRMDGTPMEYGPGIPTCDPAREPRGYRNHPHPRQSAGLLLPRDLRPFHRAACRRLPPSLHRHRHVSGPCGIRIPAPVHVG